MLNLLKRDLINRDQMVTSTQLMLESASNDDIRDTFLDSTEAMLIGAENDPEVERQVESIPESEEFDLTAEEMQELQNLEESVEEIPDAY